MAIQTRNRNIIESKLISQEPFKIASMKGGEDTGMGILPDELRARFEADSPFYVVYSYRTPIAWVSKDGEWVVPDVKYSATTTNHQNIVRVAVR